MTLLHVLFWFVDGDEWVVETFKEQKQAEAAEDALQAQETETINKNTLSVVQVEPTEGSPHHCKYS